jgi:heme exporter protein D
MIALSLSAGKYAAFVWPAYAVTLLGFAWMIVDTLARARRWRRKVDQLEADQQNPRRAK